MLRLIHYEIGTVVHTKKISFSKKSSPSQNMSRKCHLEEKVKVLEENLLLLQNLVVKGNVLIEGNLIVKGRINEQVRIIPNSCDTNVQSEVFNINVSQPSSRTIIQEDSVTSSSRVIIGLRTDGFFVFANQSLSQIIGIYNEDGLVYQVPHRKLVKITFSKGIIISIQEPIIR